MAKDKMNLGKNLTKLSEIAEWLDTQDEVDVELGLEKVKEAAGLIKESRARLAEIENEFEVIKRDIEKEISNTDISDQKSESSTDVPF